MKKRLDKSFLMWYDRSTVRIKRFLNDFKPDGYCALPVPHYDILDIEFIKAGKYIATLRVDGMTYELYWKKDLEKSKIKKYPPFPMP